jgi:undecaprenyl-diphosphatase
VSGIEAFILGLVQGLTEFLPVSSSGHLVILQSIFGSEQQGILIEITVHLATLASVLIVYRKRVAGLIVGVLRRNPDDLSYALKLGVATLPAVALVLVAGDFLDAQFESPATAGVGFLLTGTLLWTTRKTAVEARLSVPSWKAALLIGCAQAVAIMPGISRSGSTVTAALALGIAPAAAAEFSFLMSVIAISGAAVRSLPELTSVAPGEVGPLLIAAGAALIAGVAAIGLFVRLLKTQAFYRFAYYTWAAGLAVLAWLAIAN